jgi:hypothetical protein
MVAIPVVSKGTFVSVGTVATVVDGGTVSVAIIILFDVSSRTIGSNGFDTMNGEVIVVVVVVATAVFIKEGGAIVVVVVIAGGVTNDGDCSCCVRLVEI